MTEARFGWLVSYPKSGNTWMRLLLESLLNGGRPVNINLPQLHSGIANRTEFDEVFGVDSAALTEQEIELARPAMYKLTLTDFDGHLILRKVHDRCWQTSSGNRVFPPEFSRGAVYISRDPRDVAVSAAHFYGIGIDESIHRMRNPALAISQMVDSYRPQLPQPLGTWSEHVLSWLDGAGMPLHLVRYEDLKLDCTSELRKVAAFLGLNSEHAAEAAQAADFKTLQAQEANSGFRERKSTCHQFFRVGQSGGWREVLSPAQATGIQNDHHAVMRRLNYI